MNDITMNRLESFTLELKKNVHSRESTADIPELLFKVGDKVKVHGYRIMTTSPSKVMLIISDKDEKIFTWEDCVIMGEEVASEVSSTVSMYMNWLFGNTLVIEEVLNFRGNEEPLDLWKESNGTFHEKLSKVLKVRHLSKKFGL